ncbi:MAG: DUF1570 domain-containing protein [Planctomycetota bacterium]|nr:DUF1570 domain-containing protein [Planctomycetota bacterium]
MWRRLSIVGPLLVCCGCALPAHQDLLPDDQRLIREQLVIHSDFALARHHRLLDELVARRQEIANQLQLPISDERIYIYLFATREDYRNYFTDRFPFYPDRRAFFIESDTRLTVFAHWGEHVAEDLRHEVAHGYLHAVVPNLPLWLDEGLAEYYEVKRGQRGFHAAHLQELDRQRRQRRWQPDLERLESLTSVSEMSLTDYAEAWVWTHWLLETTPVRRAILCDYLARLRTTGTADPLSRSLASQGAVSARALLGHLHLLVDRVGVEHRQ